MNIKKIISGGQTGADRAALDFAIDNEIPHGGWVPRGRLAEDGVISDIYNVYETPDIEYHIRTEKNVIDSDGTLIISHGKLKGGSALTQALARKHHRPCLHVDLEAMAEFEAGFEIMHWVKQNNIEILNVAGPRSSKDPGIYEATINILETVFYVGIIEDNIPDFINHPYEQDVHEPGSGTPASIEDAVDRLIEELPLKEKVVIAGLKEDELPHQIDSLALYILNYFGLSAGNKKLLDSCRKESGEKDLNAEEATLFIIRALWQELKETHAIRRIK